MKVQELIELLENQNPNDIVILAKDAEGNNYSPLADFSLDVYDAEYSYTYIRELTPELTKRGFCEKDLCGNPEAQNCVTLWPIN